MAQNTTQGLNGAKYAGNFIMQANAPLDDRTVVDTKSKLLEYDNYVYPGMLVVSLDTNDLYQLIDVSKKSSSDYSGWKKLSGSGGIDPSVLDQKADKTTVEANERVTAQALNELKKLIDQKVPQLSIYELDITSGSTATILRSVHNCGKYPSITVYYNNNVSFAQASINNTGDVTLSWSATPTVDNPIHIVLIGKETVV